jgi:hypothetical protein
MKGRNLFKALITSTLFLVYFGNMGSSQDLENVPKDRQVVVNATTPRGHWDGWGMSSPPPKEGEEDWAAFPPDQGFVVVEYPADREEPRRFSGKVIGPASMKGVEVGLVSLVGTHWINPETYQWEPVNADGSFEILDGPKYPNARKALVVRGPETPWTFLNYNFAPNEGGEDIVLPADEPKKIRVTASGLGGENQDWVGVEPFHGTRQRGPDEEPLRRQRFGWHTSQDAKHLDLVLPAKPVALFVHRKGFASHYAKIDPREGEHFHFILKPSGKLKITVVDEQGQPVEGAEVRWINPAAPLSIGKGVTDENGVLIPAKLVPGTFNVSVGGFNERVEIDSKEMTEITLVKDKNAGFSSKDAFEAKTGLQIKIETEFRVK